MHSLSKKQVSSEESLIKKWWDKFLVLNLFVLIAGALFFLICIAANLGGIGAPYKIFQSLWYPLFIPSISLFFSAVLLDIFIKKFREV